MSLSHSLYIRSSDGGESGAGSRVKLLVADFRAAVHYIEWISIFLTDLFRSEDDEPLHIFLLNVTSSTEIIKWAPEMLRSRKTFPQAAPSHRCQPLPPDKFFPAAGIRREAVYLQLDCDDTLWLEGTPALSGVPAATHSDLSHDEPRPSGGNSRQTTLSSTGYSAERLCSPSPALCSAPERQRNRPGRGYTHRLASAPAILTVFVPHFISAPYLTPLLPNPLVRSGQQLVKLRSHQWPASNLIIVLGVVVKSGTPSGGVLSS